MIEKRKWPWVAQQDWNDVLFVHSPVPYTILRSFVPHPFEIDIYNDKGWVSIVLFQATHSRSRYMPERLSYPPFCQMNVRTYVRFGKERGVYFFSINVDDRIVSLGGNMASLPFSKASMTMQKQDDGIHFTANRLFGRPERTFDVSYKPYPSIFTPHVDSLPYFLSERYCVWTYWGNTIIKAPIYHTHWDLQQVEVTIHSRASLPFPITNETSFYYAPSKHAIMHPFEKKR